MYLNYRETVTVMIDSKTDLLWSFVLKRFSLNGACMYVYHFSIILVYSPTLLLGQKMKGLQKLAAGFGVAVSQWHVGTSGEITDIILPVVMNGPDIQMLLSWSRKISIISAIPNSSATKIPEICKIILNQTSMKHTAKTNPEKF